MNKETFEKIAENFENNYQNYMELGGIINEEDYQSTIDRMNKMPALDKDDPKVRGTIRQVENMAKHTKINLSGLEDARVRLYVTLRLDTKPKDVKYHHSQMSDQQIFVEALRMLGGVESVNNINKMIEAYPNISFKYERGK